VKTKVDLVLLREADAFAFRYACEDCVHFGSDATSDPRCTLEYPAEPRRDALRGDVIGFCKEVDLGVSEA
jgi:hypothetical protein